MDILFLDIDGVLNSETYAEKLQKSDKYDDDLIDQEAVHKLISFLKEYPDLKIVLSSSWREDTYVNTKAYLKTTRLRNLLPYIVAITPRFYSSTRGEEIKAFMESFGNIRADFLWLNGKQLEYSNYVIVDDDNDMLEEQIPHLVKTDYKYGLTDEDYDNIKTILGYV